jgi:hypothetical protein
MILADGINAPVAVVYMLVDSLQQVGFLYGLADSNAGVAAGLWPILQVFFFTTKTQTRLVDLDALTYLEQQLFLQQARSGNSRSSRARLFTIFEP